MAKKKKAAKAEEESAADDAAPAAEGGEAAPAKKGKLALLTNKKVLMFGLPALILVLGGAGAGIMLLGGGGEQVAEHGAEGEHGEEGHADAGHGEDAAHAEEHFVFYEMPEMLVNIQSENGQTSFLKLKLNIEVANEELIPVLDEAMPRVIDRYQGFLRELRSEDLTGSSGYYRLKLELLRRVNLAIAPAEAQAVNIDTLLIQ